MPVMVSALSCDSYDYNKVYETVKRSIQNLGGWDTYVKPGERVLLKTNLLAKKKPEEAVTTHPSVVKALAEQLIAHGAEVLIGDSPGGPFTAGMLNGIYKASGMEGVAAETGASLNFNVKSFEKDNPQGLIMKRLTLTDMINDVDKIISVAKLKTHGMMTFTGAVKNLFGLVPGIAKAEYHLNVPDYDRFADALIDICLCANPVLSFMDGIVGMEGAGPSAGKPVSVKVLLASPSPYHLDQAACHIIGLDCNNVPVLRRLAARNIIKADMSDITFPGEALNRFRMAHFDIPDTAHSGMNLKEMKIPGFVKQFIARHVQTRPEIKTESCTGCGICRENCPAKVINVQNKKAVIAPADCIRCYCCQELCPQKAVHIYRPRLSRLMRF